MAMISRTEREIRLCYRDETVGIDVISVMDIKGNTVYMSDLNSNTPSATLYIYACAPERD